MKKFIDPFTKISGLSRWFSRPYPFLRLLGLTSLTHAKASPRWPAELAQSPQRTRSSHSDILALRLNRRTAPSGLSGSRETSACRAQQRVCRVNCYSILQKGLFIQLLLLLVLSGGLLYGAFEQELDVIKKTYSGLASVEARFQQKIYIMALKKERESKGEFFYKRSKGFLWRYTAPKSKVFLYDGRAVWQEEEDKSFVIKERVNKERMQGNFLDLVEDISKLDQYFTVKNAVKQDGGELLELLPKKEGTIQSARAWTDRDHLVTKIEITEITGNVNAITFSSIKVNKALPDSLFVFNPGTREIVER